jgi:ABC-type sugar transport system substrate-binding protein
MKSTSSSVKRVLASVLIAVAAVSVAACGGSSNSSSSSSSSGSSSSASSGAEGASSAQGKRVAYLAAAKGNAYVDAAVKAITAEAAKQGVKLTVFDAQFNPQKQLSQCQDAVTQKFDAIVALPAAGVPLIPCASQAAAAKIPFVDTNQPIGTSTSSGEPTAKGVTSQVLTPLDTIAGNDAKQAAAACGSANPCRVILLSAAKILPQQAKAYEDALKNASSSNSKIKVTSVDAGADRPGGLKAMQDVLQRIPKPSVVLSPNSQPVEGAVQAMSEAGLTPGKNVQVVSNGATSYEFADVKSGKYFSTYTQLPGTEARLALQFALQAAGGQKPPTWMDPHKPNNVPLAITKENVSELGNFTPEW